ncbi:MAG: AF1514 family protein [Thiobacillus sp.]|nr:AF1514 family protein [Thiobacillus sp.]
MKTLRLDTTELGLDFNAALKLATAISRQQLDEDAMLLSWYDRERDLESPAGTKGSWDYALNRGARLAVEFDSGRYTFCFL